MVVPTRRNRARSIVPTLLLVALLAAPAVQFPAPAAEAQTSGATANPQLTVDPEVDIYQNDASVPTHFVTNGTMQMSVVIRNNAQGPGLTNVPVYYWFPNNLTMAGGCRLVSVPAA